MDSEIRNMFKKDFHTPQLVEYFEKLAGADEGFSCFVLDAMRKVNMGGGRVSSAEGRILESFVRSLNAKKAVDIGAMTGYFGHWIARGMPDGGRLYSLEKNPTIAQAARECFEKSNLLKKVTVMEGAALDSLKTLSKLAPFDFCFIAADIENYPAYLRWAAANLRPGGIVAADNAFLKGNICQENGEPAENARARAMREFFHVLFDGDRFVSASIIPTGEGLAIGVKS